jgi:hypothetical protein
VKQVLQKVALALGGIVFALALCEGLVWLTPSKLLPPRLREVSERLALYRSTDGMFIDDAELLFKIRPHYDAMVAHPDYHVRVKTNLNLDGIGFRGGSVGGAAWAVAVGDSFTFGVGVEQEDTWVYRLAKSLDREVVNLAIPAQGPPQYTRVLKRYALPLRPKVVFYGFYFNDLDTANRFYRMQRRVFPVSRYLRQYSVLYNLINDSRAAGAGAAMPPAGAATHSVDAVGPAAPTAAPVNAPNDNVPLIRRILERQQGNFERRWRWTVKELDDALQACREAQIEMVMLYLPSRWEVYWESIKARHQLPDSLDIDRLRRAVVDYCGARKIACVDLTAALKEEAQRGKELYFPIDGHWNKDGNRIVAEALQSYSRAKGLAG